MVCLRQWLMVWLLPSPPSAGESTACVCGIVVGGNEESMAGRSWGRKKYKILVLIKGWDIYISHSLDNSHFVRSFFTYSGTERAVSESQVSLHKATWI